ncbi:MAG: MBL fold metallo-hydrolase [Planctomycetota bacterium]
MSRIITCSIQSGSNGNSIYVEAGETRLLFDAGVSGKTVRARLAEHGRSPDHVDALFISHEHDDHLRSAGIYQRMFGVPIYLTRQTHAAAWRDLGRVHDVRYFRSGAAVEVDGVVVHTVPTPHDAADGVAFVVEFGGKRLGIFTDLGHPFAGLADLLASVDAAYLESNYDPRMLEAGPYPYPLKRRIAGPSGHLSNPESAGLVRRTLGRKHQWIALSHLSEQNNTPELALETHFKAVGCHFPFGVSSRYAVSALREV